MEKPIVLVGFVLLGIQRHGACRNSTLGYASPQQLLSNWLSSQHKKVLAA
jgi:hypothetical protein